MTQQSPLLHGPLRERLIALRRQCEFRRRLALLSGFGLHIALAVGVTTLFFAIWADHGWPRRVAELAFVVAVIYGVKRWLWPLFRYPITLEKVAIYLDERHPELQNRMVSLVSLNSPEDDRNVSFMVDSFLRDTQQQISNMMIPFKLQDLAPERKVWIAAAMLLAVPLMFIVFRGQWSPTVRWLTSQEPELTFTVSPGDTKVRAGDDVIVVVNTPDDGQAVTIFWRETSGWQETAMRLGDTDRLFFHTFKNVRANFQYRVRVGNQRSPVYKVRTWLPPEVMAVDVVYHYPEYLQLPPRATPNSTDLSTLAGSTVEIQLQANKPLRAAAMIFDDGTVVNFRAGEANHWTGSFPALSAGTFHYRLTDRDDEENPFQPTYNLSISPDRPPSVQIDFPYNDLSVTALEEINFSFRVNDDFGLAEYGLQYQVAGREPVYIDLSKDLTVDTHQAEGRYFLPLESLELKAGDLITWSVKAKDRKPDRLDYEALQDPYFLEIRPFKRYYREAVSNQNGGMGGGGGGDLVTKQKEALVATWNLRRGLKTTDAEAFAADLSVVQKAQGAILEAVMESQSMPRGAPEFARLLEALEKANNSLSQAEWPDPAPALTQATAHQQNAYQLLLLLEPPEQQIQRSQGSSQGTGSQRRDGGVDELEIERNRKFYEEEKRTREQQQAAAETLNEIRELAQRQQMINDAIAKLISELDNAVSEEERKRRLERLQEEARKNLNRLDEMREQMESLSPQTAESVRQNLDEAREDMNRGLENMEQEQLQEAQASGSRASNRLQDIQENLQKEARAGTGERVKELRETMESLKQQQADIRRQIEGLDEEKDSPSLNSEDPEHAAKNRLAESKEALMEAYRQLMEDAAQTANLSRGSQSMVARKLGDWLRETSKEGIEEGIAETQDMLNLGMWDDLDEKEAQIEEKLGRAAEGLEEVAGLLAEDDLDAKRKALQQLEELERRARERGTWSEDDLQQFAGTEYREWLDRLENATDLLPPGNGLISPLMQVRREIEKVRSRFRREELAPEFDLILTEILEPLTRGAAQLREEVARESRQQEFFLTDEGSVPDHYRKRVAEYFESLSAAEEKP